jgi:hypothetical protein
MSQLKIPLPITYHANLPAAGIKGRIIPTPDGIVVIYGEKGQTREEFKAELRVCLEWHKFAHQLTPLLQAEFEREMAKT